MKKLLVIVTMMIMLIAMAAGLAYAGTDIVQSDIDEGLDFCKDYPVQLALDGKEITFLAKDVPPVIIKERTLIPARALFEAMGGQVAWDNETQSVHVTYDDTEVVLNIGSNQAWVNGEIKELEVPALIIDHDGDYYGSTMIPVRFTAEELGCGVAWEDSTRSVLITSQGKDIPIIDSITGNDNQNTDADNNPIINPNTNTTTDTAINTDTITDTAINTDITTNTAVTWQFEQLNEAAKGKIVAIDIGHGGKDSGTIGHEGKTDQIYEKDLNFPTGIKLNEYLKSAGVSTYMIRETDIFYTLLERSQMANDIGATVFVSIHNNASDYATPHGTEVLYNSKKNVDDKSEMELYGIESKNIAKNVQNEMVTSLGTFDRGIKNSPGMAVLNKTSMPAIIVEGAFFSNASDFEMMTKPEYTDNYALAVAKGIIKSLNEAFK